MIQIFESLFGETPESVFVQREDEINYLSQYVVQRINEIDVQNLYFQDNSQAFVIQYGNVYIDKCNQIEKHFKIKSPHNYAAYTQKIQIMIAKRLRKIAKQKEKVIYKTVLQSIISKSKYLDIPLEKKENIHSLNEQYQQHYLKFVQTIYENQPKSMYWILIKFEEKMKKKMTYQLIQKQREISNLQESKSLVTLVEDYIHTYFISTQFWILNKDYIIQLIQFLFKLNKSKFQDVQQGLQRFILEISSLQQFDLNQNDFNKIFQQQEQKIEKYFFENFKRDQTIQLIVEIFIILSGFKFENNTLFIEQYQPSSHAFLLKFCEQINDGKWKFTNSYILKLADKSMGQIHYQIIEKLHQNQKHQISLKIKKQDETIEIFGRNDEALSNFKLKNSAYYNSSQYLLSDSQASIDKTLHNHFSLFINKIEQQKPKDLVKYMKPEIFCLQSLSKGQMRSNVITIFVNGFITQDDLKVEKLWPFNQDSYLETLVLGWSASCKSTIGKFATLGALFGTTFVGSAIGAILVTAGKLLSQFNSAFQEAKIVGKYLAYFLDLNYLGIKAINLIGYSLGTVIVFYCLKQLIKLQKEQNKDRSQIIHNVLMMGGVADRNLLSKLDFRCISGTFHNVYSEGDKVLSLVLPIYNKNITPCGLNPVYSIHPNVKNHNFTQRVSGHLKYQGEIIKDILKLINFDDQYLIF